MCPDICRMLVTLCDSESLVLRTASYLALAKLEYFRSEALVVVIMDSWAINDLELF